MTLEEGEEEEQGDSGEESGSEEDLEDVEFGGGSGEPHTPQNTPRALIVSPKFYPLKHNRKPLALEEGEEQEDSGEGSESEDELEDVEFGGSSGEPCSPPKHVPNPYRKP